MGGRRRRWGRRESLGCKNSGRTGGAAVRPKVDTMVWSKSFGVSDMRDKQGVPCNLPEALLRNPNCWPLGTRTSRNGWPGTQYTSALSKAPGPCRGSIEHLVKPAVVLRCWSSAVGGAWPWWWRQRRRRPDLKSRISNPKPAKQFAEVMCCCSSSVCVCVRVCFGSQKRRPANHTSGK